MSQVFNGNIKTSLYKTEELVARLGYLDKSRDCGKGVGLNRANEIISIREELLARNFQLPTEGRRARRLKQAA